MIFFFFFWIDGLHTLKVLVTCAWGSPNMWLVLYTSPSPRECYVNVLLQQTCKIYFSLVAFKHLHTQACMSARNVHTGLHPTRPILIRMETTHENALLPWWPARIERCSEGNFQCVCVCVCAGQTHTYGHIHSQNPCFSLIWWQESVSPVWWHTQRKVCVGFSLPAGLPRTHRCAVRLTPFWLQTPQEQKEQPETWEILS